MSGFLENPMMPVPFRIERVRRETGDTFTLELQPAAAGGFHFAAGQFNMLYIFGTGEVPISISGDPGQPQTLVHTTRAVGAVTNKLKTYKRGDMVGVRGPFGSHWPVDESTGKDLLIAAGGLGLAPLRPALYRALATREKFGKVVLLYGTRTPGDILFQRELEKWRARFDLDIFVTVGNASGGWRGDVGWITALLPRAPIDPARTAALICGPELMMRTTAQELARRGVSESDIYVSMERNMKCAVGFCGHCQFGPQFVCKDGPVFRYSRVKELLRIREV